MMTKIETLSDEQKALMPVYRDKWLDIGLASGPTDKVKSEAAVRKAYRCAGIPEPELFIWTESPLHSSVLYGILTESLKNDSVRASVRDSVGDSVWASVWDSVRASVRDSVRDSVGASVGDSVRDSVRDSVWASVWDSVRASVRDSVGASVWASVRASVRDSVRDSVGDSVGASVWASVWDSVRDSVGDSVGDSLNRSCYGLHDASWLAFYQYFQEVVEVDCSKLEGLWDCAKEGGWFIPFRNFVIISPKPLVVKTRPNTRGTLVLHADGEPALYYCDDFKIYANDGVRIPEKYGAVPVAKWEPRWIIEEKNVDIRAKLLKGIGYERFLEAVSAEVVHKQEIYGLPYELLQFTDRDMGLMKFLKMKNPSVPGVYHVEAVPPHKWIATCDDALRWRQIGDKARDKSIQIQYQFIK